jgi:membrane-associated phospholipid phosphatase
LNEVWLILSLSILGFLILTARVYGGMHYVSDILAGLLFGFALTSVLLYTLLIL